MNHVSTERGEAYFNELTSAQQAFFAEAARQMNTGHVLINPDIHQIMEATKLPIQNRPERAEPLFTSNKAKSIMRYRGVRLLQGYVDSHWPTFHDGQIAPVETDIIAVVHRLHGSDPTETAGSRPELDIIINRWMQDAEQSMKFEN